MPRDNDDRSTDKITLFLQQAEPLIEQLNNLYQQFIIGIEKRPPIEKRKRLDQLMANLLMMPKPTAALKFRCNSLHAQYLTYRDRWDRMLKDFEVGKIRRPLS